MNRAGGAVGARFHALDGMRGAAALCVTLFHIDYLSIRLLGHIPLGFALNSYLFVDLFFVLSGFVIASSYRDRLNTRSELVAFGLRRFMRLWPLHIFMLLTLVLIELVRLYFFTKGGDAIGVPFGPQERPAMMLANVFLLQSFNLFPFGTWNVPSWSIGAEFYTYAVFALSCQLRGRLRLLAWAALAVAGVAVVTRYSSTYIDVSYEWGFFRCLMGFFAGVLTQEIYRGTAATCRGWRGFAAMELLLTVVVVGFVASVGRSPATYYAPLLFALTVYVFAFSAGPVSRWLCGGTMQWLGRISYSIYMVHWTVLLCIPIALHALQRFGLAPPDETIYAALPAFGGDAFVLVYLGVTCTAASITWRWIEMPPQAWLAKRLSGRSDRRGGPESPHWPPLGGARRGPVSAGAAIARNDSLTAPPQVG